MSQKTDIVATLGPASETADVLDALVQVGMTIARFNFSHNTHDWHTDVLQKLRRNNDVKILQDLCGPKIRTVVQNSFTVIPGDVITFSDHDTREDKVIQLNIPKIIPLLKSETRVLLYDGTIELRIVSNIDGVVTATVVRGGETKNNKGVNLPGVALPVSSLTEKDIKDIAWAVAHNADYIALSFVKTAQDIHDLKKAIASYSTTYAPKIIVKIETVEALENLESIIREVDVVMVARGDLGVEIGLEHVPAEQKRIIQLCNSMNKPVIVATEMMQTMKEKRVPTRAEVSDVFNAVVDGATGVMLSAESATGVDPVNVVQMMRRICNEAEHYKTSLL
jgi:pyruvate kinase